MDERRLGRDRGVRREHGEQRLVLDGDQRGGVLRSGAPGRGDRDDRLATQRTRSCASGTIAPVFMPL